MKKSMKNMKDPMMVPSDGRDSNAGKLLESRHKSVSFTAGDGGAGANVTQRKSSTGSHRQDP